MAAKEFIVGGVDTKWSTSGNWNPANKPVNGDTVTINAAVTAMNLDETTCQYLAGFDMSGAGAGFTLSGSGEIYVNGDLKLKSGMTWSGTGNINLYTNAIVLTTNSVNLGNSGGFRIRSGADVTLADDVNIGTKEFVVNGAGSSLITANYAITCGIFHDNGVSGAITLTLGTSTINCRSVGFGTCTLTVSHTGALNITAPAATDLTLYFGGQTWAGTTTISLANGRFCNLAGSPSLTNTFGNFAISWTALGGGSRLLFNGNQTITGTLTITGWDVINHSLVCSNYTGTAKPLTAGAINITGGVDFRDVAAAGASSPWDLSGINSGDCGGNSNITFKSPRTLYLVGMTANRAYKDDNYSTSDGGAPGGTTVYPLPQDTLIINDNSGNNTNKVWNCGEYFGSTCSIDASALTESLTITFYAGGTLRYYGDLILTGANLTVTSTSGTLVFDARPRYEDSGDTLDINILPAIGSGNITLGQYEGQAGTVRLITNNLTHTGTFTLSYGKFDLNGQTLTTGIFSSSNSNTRELKDSAGGGKIIVNGLTGTLFDMSTVTSLTVSNAPDIDVGDSNNTLTGDVTFAGGGKTFGDFKVTKHAGNYDCIITGSNTFGSFTLETPDATYQYSYVQFTSGTDNNITSLVATGTSDYAISIKAVTGASAATLSDTTGTNTVSYCVIQDMTAEGGATWDADDGTNTNVSGNTGWTWTSGEALTKDLTDSITLSDAVLSGYGKNLSDTLTLSDAIYKAMARPQADTMTLSDAIAKAIKPVKADTINLSDASTKAIGMSRTDSVTLSDALAKTIQIAKSDTITLSDAFNAIITLILALSDTITLSDSLARAMGVSRTDSLTLSDMIAKQAAFTRSDTLTLVDAFLKAAGLNKADTITLSDSVAKEPRLSRSDMVILADMIEKAFHLSSADILTMTDEFYKSSGALSLSLDDTITMSDFISLLTLALESGETASARRFMDTIIRRQFIDTAPARSFTDTARKKEMH